jgi:hypothetical protein
MDIVGTWKLVSWENRNAAGERDFPMGDDANGYIGYTADGHMFVQITARGRTPYADGDPLGGTAEERSAAITSLIAYCGRYTLYDDRVVHHAEISSFPNWEGADQVRFASIEGDRLELSTGALMVDGEVQTAHLIWERV